MRSLTIAIAVLAITASAVISAENHKHEGQHGGVVVESGHHHLEIVANDGVLEVHVNGEDGKKYLAHTLNNTVVAPPRMLIAFLENNLNADGTVSIPEVLRMYMGGKEKLVPKH